MFARGGDDDGYDYPDSGDEQPLVRTRRVSGDDPGRSRGDNGGRQRSIQFQPEERYWTDYLRIALPVIGLLLMVGLFWYWVQMLIDDPSTTEPEPTTTAQGLPEVATSPSTPAPPAATDVDANAPPVAGATQAPPSETRETDTNATETPPEENPAEDPLFAPG